MLRILGVLIAVSGLSGLVGCASGPKSAAQKASLDQEADRTVASMTARDPDLGPLLDQSAGYVVFPDVKQGGLVVGGAGGKGVLFQHGQPVGYADLSQGSIGAQVGGQSFSEVIVLRDQAGVDRMKAGTFDVGGQAAAVAVKAGAAAATQFGEKGVAVFVQPKGGAMLNVSVTGQRVKFTG